MIKTTENIVTIYCNCSYYDFIPEKTKKAVLQSLTDSGIKFEAVADLCSLAAEKDPILQKWIKADKLRIIACFPRAVKWLLHAGDTNPSGATLEFFNMRTRQAEEIVESLGLNRNNENNKDLPVFEKKTAWVPWFPVIDYSMCKNCKQCMNFCLFGTFGLTKDGTIEVRNPSHCKTNCPACARVCPSSAIIFPKYSESPINGDEVTDQIADQSRSSKLSEAMQGNIYEAIRKRSKDRDRFSSKTKQGDSDSYINKLRKELNIPDDVIAALSPAELIKLHKKTKTEKSSSDSPSPDID